MRRLLLFSLLLIACVPAVAQGAGESKLFVRLSHSGDPSGPNNAVQAPDFSLTDFEGQPLTLSQYKGKVVLLDFWASWCVPCQAEIPRFTEWQKKYGEEGLQVIGISMDDDEKAARKFVERLKPNYPIAMGNAKLAESYGEILGLPANLVISREGRIRSKHVGATDLDDLEKEILVQLALQ